MDKINTHVIPIVQNVNNTIRTISEFPLIDACPVKAYDAAIVGLHPLLSQKEKMDKFFFSRP